MNSKGQPVAPFAPPSQPAASSMSPDNFSSGNQGDFIIIGDSAARAKKTKKRKIIIIAAIVVGILLVVAGIALLVANINKSSDNDSKSTDQTMSEQIKDKVETTFNDSGAKGVISYVDDIENSANADNVSKDELAETYIQAAMQLSRYIAQFPEELDAYKDKILAYWHKVEDIQHSIYSAEMVYWAEKTYGSMEIAEKYKQIAIKRGSTTFEIRPEGGGLG